MTGHAEPAPRAARRHRVRGLRLGVFLTACLVAAAGGSAWGYWTASATGTGQVTTHDVAVTQSGFSALGTTYRNDVLTSTGYLTVKNSGTADGHVTLNISGAGNGLAGTLPVRVWPVANTTSCTPGASVPAAAATGTWASLATSTAVPVAAGGSIVYCVRTTAASRQSLAVTSGTQSGVSTLTVTLDDDEGWTGTRTVTATSTQSTSLIFPYAAPGSPGYTVAGLSDWFTVGRAAGGGFCLDAADNGGPGDKVITWNCHHDPNQRWEILPATDKGPNLVRLRPKHGAGFHSRLSVSATGKLSIESAAAGAANQLWEIQRVSASTYQIVADISGLCLTMGATAVDTPATVTPCRTGAATRANQVLTLTREPLIFEAGSGWFDNDITFGFNANSTTDTGWENYQLQRKSGASWVDVGDSTGTFVTELVVAKSRLSEGLHEYRIVLHGTSDVVYGDIHLKMTRNGFNRTVTAESGVG